MKVRASERDVSITNKSLSEYSRSSTKSKMKDESSLLTTDNRQQISFNVKHSTLNVNCVATIGSFDGVHRGHQCLLSQVRQIADERKLNAMAITFGGPEQLANLL